jgi:drug/metabolite transporter (DMT)-like permease
MALVAIAAALMATIFSLFKVFERRNVPLLPAIAVNYLVAFLAGLVFAPPWAAESLSGLHLPALGLAVLFVLIFYLTGLSAQRAGLAATTVASRMSLVLTVLFAVVVYKERPALAGWLGILLALVSVVLVSLVKGPAGARGAWRLPLMIFLGNAAIDITINLVQRTHLRPDTEAVFPTLIFLPSAVLAFVWVFARSAGAAFRAPSVWIGGTVLGVVNYASLVAIVKALTYGGFPASSFYPLMNVGVILLGSGASMLLFGERLRRAQLVGIGLAVIALGLILSAT